MAISNAITVTKHGCQPMLGKVTNRAVRVVNDIFIRPTYGSIPIKKTKKKRPSIQTLNHIEEISAKPAKRENVIWI